MAKVFVNEWVARYGVPLMIHLDQRRNFESRLFKEVCRILGIDKQRTTPGNPKSDGLVERLNRTLADMISKTCDENQRNWDDVLPLVMMGYRSSRQSSTGFSPAFLQFGRSITLPADVIYGPREFREEPTTPAHYAECLQEGLFTVYEKVRRHLGEAFDRQKRYYDLVGRVKNEFQAGQLCWYHNPVKKKGLSPKLQSPWKGPIKVLAVISDVVRRIVTGPRGRQVNVHVDRLKPYTGDNPPDWVNRF